MKKRRFFYSFVIILLLIVVVAGWFATEYLGNKARQEIIGESRASALTLSTYVSSTLNNLEGAVKSLAGSPWIAPVLLSKGKRDIEQANSALDRYNSALNASVSYLMDADGMTVASSNRKDPDSFLGKSYRFRPYYQEAAKGHPARYFALGITSGKRGFYASYPVHNRLGKVLGVVTMKKDLDDMETFFSKYPFCSLINPDGIIFLSSKPSMVLKSLWPLDKAVRGKLIASQQFGNKPFEAVMKKEIADGAEVTLEGKEYFVSRKVIDSDGWSIVLLAPTDRISTYKLVGIITTIFVCFLIMFFSGIIYVTDRSKEALRESEEKYRTLIETTRDLIYTADRKGFLTYMNPTFERTLGYLRDEWTRKNFGQIVAPDCIDAVKDLFKRAMKGESIPAYEVDLIRKDGARLSVEFNVSTIYDNEGKPSGRYGIGRDVTDRKQAEVRDRLAQEALKILNRSDGSMDTVRDILQLIKKNTGFEAVGIRLREGDDFPYYDTNGFSDDFILAER